MQNRRNFIKQGMIGGGLLAAGGFPFSAFAATGATRITILHTNDVHSRLDPFPMDGSKFQGMGGVAARAELIRQIRTEEEHVLLLDAGDIFQGTPYFNLYKGEPEIKAMSMMEYDAATMGNHDFDAGVEGFAKQLPHASFPILVANYDFRDTELADKTQPYKIFTKGGIKIGIFGLGIQLLGLVPQDAYGKTKFLDPLPIAIATSDMLKNKKKCDMVICLSHLGYEYKSDKISDCVLAANTEHIDLIIGGHTHTFLDKPTLIKNKAGKEVIINQVGWAGIRLGKLDFVFDSKKSAKLSNAQTVILRKQTIG
ncbi:bifunctional metallophosphatase/5'-nucleotidase [Taibaiella chishuiensis]|uniref:5'-nucleotidase n=1 Tax=Taibaiella chishuiensis TaxID=1434707 RepID=A0A2P8D1H5_9BACT|nr:metallophosphatase [Taibaiella chishuiensis]PSK91026.1 5'-nucleotidase [Taibaiella chishuiensis]